MRTIIYKHQKVHVWSDILFLSTDQRRKYNKHNHARSKYENNKYNSKMIIIIIINGVLLIYILYYIILYYIILYYIILYCSRITFLYQMIITETCLINDSFFISINMQSVISRRRNYSHVYRQINKTFLYKSFFWNTKLIKHMYIYIS